MTNFPQFLILPRLHRELTAPEGLPFPLPALPGGAAALWPGLPHPPDHGAFVPDYAWNSAQAAACVADFEQTGRAGAGGAPVLPFSVAGLLGAGDDLSPEERRALDELTGHRTNPSGQAVSAVPPSAATAEPAARRAAAQRVLLLAWLQERQVLELRALERKVASGRSALAGLLGEGEAPLAASGSAGSPPEPWAGERPTPGGDDAPLPPWRSVLAAAAVFLPGLAGSAASADDAPRLVVTDPAMAAAVAGLAPGLEAAGDAPAAAPTDAPPGFMAVRAPLGRVLGRGWHTPEASRVFLFLYPSQWAAPAPERS